MTRITSNEFVAAAQLVQREAVQKLETAPRLAIVREFDPSNPDRYKPTASYAAQIRNHAALIGVDTDDYVVLPGSGKSAAGFVRELRERGDITGIMPLYPLDDKEAVKEELAKRPEQDVDDLLGRGNRAPTARAMIAMGNICLHPEDAYGQPYYVGRTLDDMSRLDLPAGYRAEDIRLGGKGELTGTPLVSILGAQGIEISDEQIATASTPDRLRNLPYPALVFTATPVAEQIQNHDIPYSPVSEDGLFDGPRSVIVDAGFGVIDGVTYGNASRHAETRSDVLWTPPREGVGPVSTVYLHHHLLEAAGVPIEDLQPLGTMMMQETVDYHLV
jgi:5,10-methylene-tetrahydrofolate dehydrogenase/methenyl tetrahydrofolate cyclohydrolase